MKKEKGKASNNGQNGKAVDEVCCAHRHSPPLQCSTEEKDKNKEKYDATRTLERMRKIINHLSSGFFSTPNYFHFSQKTINVY